MSGFFPTAERHGFRSDLLWSGLQSGCRQNRYIFHSLASYAHPHYPIIHELLKYQSHYHHRVLTAYKILGYPSSSGKKKEVEVLITIGILNFIRI